MHFYDLLYGRIELPDWLEPFVRLPEFTRLRGVRLSNVDSIDFKDFGRASRWEHAIGVAYLALECARNRLLSTKDQVELVLAALLHDIATPPFAHTVEYVCEGFDHERETQMLLGDGKTDYSNPSTPVYSSALPRFHDECEKLSRSLKVKIEPENVAQYIVGEGNLGFLVSGTLDLDNADNVIRGAKLMGLPVDSNLPIQLARWLAEQDSIPTSIEDAQNEFVRQWYSWKKEYYLAFFNATDVENGRQAFLQHLIRAALAKGLTNRALIWNTDDGLLNDICLQEKTRDDRIPSLAELVNRYRLLEPVNKVFELPIYDEDSLRILSTPNAVSWMEKEITIEGEQLFLMASKKRVKVDSAGSLGGKSIGKLSLYKLGIELNVKNLPGWVLQEVGANSKGKKLIKAFAEIVSYKIREWVKTRPWHGKSPERVENIVRALEQVGDWSFRYSRNETLHTYPSTFVHAIPATIIETVGLQGAKILDPFGGTGQTALEVLKSGGDAISTDINYVALLTSRVKFTYLDKGHRKFLSDISEHSLMNQTPCTPPVFHLREKWHHADTLMELCQIKSFIHDVNDEKSKNFLKLAFSAILTSSTSRRGKQHGWFADNTPLAKGVDAPEYQPAIEMFIGKIKSNLAVLKGIYGSFERKGLAPEKELARAIVKRVDAARAKPADYPIEAGTLSGIITSPPYLCMTDYTLGQRLSYYWLAPEMLEADFGLEIGPRRKRTSPNLVLESYFNNLNNLTITAKELLAPGGLVVTVLGQPQAKAFKKIEVFKETDKLFENSGFKKLWTSWRQIHWHRNQGYQHLRKELITVYESC